MKLYGNVNYETHNIINRKSTCLIKRTSICSVTLYTYACSVIITGISNMHFIDNGYVLNMIKINSWNIGLGFHYVDIHIPHVNNIIYI